MSETNETITTPDEQTHPVRCYDNGGETADRYTVVYMEHREPGTQKMYASRGMSADPYDPLGIAQMCTATPGSHLGARIPFAGLPTDCRRVVLSDLSTVPPRIVSAPLGASAYKNQNTERALAHAVEIDARGDVLSVLCKRAKPESILPDSSQFNRHHVDCPRCVSILNRRGIKLPTRE